ncbi:MAG: hypothetical protein R3A10_14960 [Caldilineaceae bacterium]
MSPEMRVVLAQLSVFASAFARDAMRAMRAGQDGCLPGIAAPHPAQTETEAGLVFAAPVGETVAAQRLAAKGLEEETRERHNRYFLARFDLGEHTCPRVF